MFEWQVIEESANGKTDVVGLFFTREQAFYCSKRLNDKGGDNIYYPRKINGGKSFMIDAKPNDQDDECANIKLERSM